MLLVAAVAVGYAVGAEVAWRSFEGLAFFPPAGITLAAFVYSSRRSWPLLCAVILVVEIVVDLRHDVVFVDAFGYGVFNVIEPLVGASLFRRWRPRGHEFSNRGDVLSFVLGPCVLGPAACAIGLATISVHRDGGSWLVRFAHLVAGDGVAVLAISSTIMLLVTIRPSRRWAVEASFGVVAMAGLSTVTLLSTAPLRVVVLLAFGWAIFRLGPAGVSLFGTTYAVTANYLTGLGHGMFADLGYSRDVRIAFTQANIAVLFLMAWMIGIEVRERRRFEAEQIERRDADLLRDHAARLAAAVYPNDVARATCQIVRLAFGTDPCAVAWNDARSLSVLLMDGDVRHPTEHWMEGSTAANPMLANAIDRGAIDELRDLMLPDTARSPISAVLHVPTRENAGMVGIGFTGNRSVTSSERALLEGISTQHGIALERAVLHDREERRRRRAETLQHLASELAAISTPESMAAAIARNAGEMLDADYARLALVDREHETFIFYHGDTVSVELLERWHPAPLTAPLPSRAVFESGRPLVFNSQTELVRSFPEVTLGSPGWDYNAFATVPISVDGVTIGALSFAWDSEGVVDDDAVAVMVDIAENCAAALARATRAQREAIIAEREHQTAARLQRALLPDLLASVANLQLAARYVPADENLQVGGDWYETLVPPDGRLAVAVGDIVGHGLEAAATMGRMRTAFAALAPSASTPLELLTKLDDFARTVKAAWASTVVCVFIDPSDGLVTFASAGHPPIVVRRDDGEAFVADGGRSWPLAVLAGRRHGEATVPLDANSTLILYSDGLIEGRREPLDVGVERLRLLASAETSVVDTQDFCDRIVGGLVADTAPSDDVVVLAITYRPAIVSLLNMTVPAVPEQLGVVRAQIREVLAQRHVDPADVVRVVLAVGEACTNVVEHGYQMAGGDLKVTVEIDLTGALVVWVRDQGVWRTPVYDRNRGRGTAVMEGMADTFLRRTNDNGTAVRLGFRVGDRNSADGRAVESRV